MTYDNGMIRKHMYISGQVQGVSFRAQMQRTSQSLGFTGWVRNLPDGRVEAMLEGTEDNWPALFDWSRQGPAGARVVQVEVMDEPYTGEYHNFRIRY